MALSIKQEEVEHLTGERNALRAHVATLETTVQNLTLVCTQLRAANEDLREQLDKIPLGK